MAQFGQSLLASDPPISGLDESIVIKPERLHLTLGVMSLSNPSTRPNKLPSRITDSDKQQVAEEEQANERTATDELPVLTIESALHFLRRLQPLILQRLVESPISIDFTNIDVMRPPRGTRPGEAHVLWIGPQGEQNTKLHEVCSECRI